MLGKSTPSYGTEVVKAGQLSMVNEDEHPEYFSAGSYASLQKQQHADEKTYLYTLKDAHDYSLVDNAASLSAEYLSVQLRMCDNSTAVVECADFGDNHEHLKSYLETLAVTF